MPEEAKEVKKVDAKQPEVSTPVTPPTPQKTNTLSIVGLIMAFIIPIVGLVCSIIGISQTNKRNEKGKGLAVAGVIISILNMLFQFIMLIVIIVAAAASSNITLESFTNANPNYTIKYPKGWVREVENQDGAQGYIFKDAPKDNTGKVYGQTEIVYIAPPPNGYKSDVLVAISDSIKSKYSGTVVNYESRDTVNGNEALRLIITYNGENGKIKAKITILKKKDGSVYTLVTQSPEENYSKYSDAFDEIHNTFQP